MGVVGKVAGQMSWEARSVQGTYDGRRKERRSGKSNNGGKILIGNRLQVLSCRTGLGAGTRSEAFEEDSAPAKVLGANEVLPVSRALARAVTCYEPCTAIDGGGKEGRFDRRSRPTSVLLAQARQRANNEVRHSEHANSHSVPSSTVASGNVTSSPHSIFGAPPQRPAYPK